jgi:type II secretory pathway pseudopilin PulG
MWRSSGRPRRLVRGFTLIEAMVSLLLLIIVLTVAMTMLFQMRAFAERQQFYMLPRQAARRAADYLSYYVAGASDLNDQIPSDIRKSPNALIMYYNLNGAPVQASFENLAHPDAVGNAGTLETGNSVTSPGVSAFGDFGTDLLTLVTPTSPAKYRAFPPFPALGPSVDLFFNFRGGCAGGDSANLAAFQAATGFDGTKSALLMLVDGNGNWTYFQIPAAGYLTDGVCTDVVLYKNIHVQADTASATLPAPPNGNGALVDPVNLITGIQVISFRVRTDPADNIPKLQQKLGLFDPSTDNPGTGFVNVMENVEDFQVAYIYAQEPVPGNGTLYNTSTQTIGVGDGVPPQVGPSGVPTGYDIVNVIGLRFSITSRSPRLSLAAQQLTNVNVKENLSTTTGLHFRPASEDHPVLMDSAAPTRPKYDLFDHYRATTTLLLRNRTLGS